jgi:hypothetical protein
MKIKKTAEVAALIIMLVLAAACNITPEDKIPDSLTGGEWTWSEKGDSRAYRFSAGAAGILKIYNGNYEGEYSFTYTYEKPAMTITWINKPASSYWKNYTTDVFIDNSIDRPSFRDTNDGKNYTLWH